LRGWIIIGVVEFSHTQLSTQITGLLQPESDATNWTEYSWRSERSEKNDLAAGCDEVVAKDRSSIGSNA
jgi:hypothetical protein